MTVTLGATDAAAGSGVKEVHYALTGASSGAQVVSGDSASVTVSASGVSVIVNLIGATRTAAALRGRCELDRGAYPKGRDIADTQMATLNLEPHRFHGDWNYTIHPRRRRK